MPRYSFPATGNTIPGMPGGSAVPPKEQYQTPLETQFPHILSAIQALWGFKELNAYFSKLMLDERGTRAGFPPDVWDDINTLLRLHQELMPEPLFATNQSRHALDFSRNL